MTQQELLEYNKRCAEFLGGENHPSLVPYTPEPDDMWFAVDTCPNLQRPEGGSMWKLHELKFHSDWNWIMEVKDMIQRKFYFVDILGCGICTIKGIEGKTKNPHISAASDEPKEAVIQAINQFLIWYNDNSK